MLKTRVIPCLLLKKSGLVKTIRFDKPVYVGDPINAIKIFNDKCVDELIFLDITATPEKRGPNFKLISEITSECFMPLAYGGGITSLDQIGSLLKIGVEKIIINTGNLDLNFLASATKTFGASTIVAAIDVKKNLLGKQRVYTHCGTKSTGNDLISYAKKMEQAGVGEIFLNSIDRDGTMTGYDLGLIRSLSKSVSVPVVASGGAGSLSDFKQAVDAGASAVAAGSMFVFKGPNRAVLINYPNINELERVLK